MDLLGPTQRAWSAQPPTSPQPSRDIAAVGAAPTALRAQVNAASISGSPKTPSAAPVDQLLDKIVAREQEFLLALGKHSPLFETYIQEFSSPVVSNESLPMNPPPANSPILSPARLGVDLTPYPSRDQYFLGRARLDVSVDYNSLLERTSGEPQKTASEKPARDKSKSKVQELRFLPRGFAQMAVVDLHGFNRQNYNFEYVRREFLGDVRCLVFDVAPANREPGRFVGRIWVEDQAYAMVRFNGTYLPAIPAKNAAPELYFHFDSWRVNIATGEWIPAQIYVEEEGTAGSGTRFKAQTRVWDYATAPISKLDELTQLLIEDGSGVKDRDAQDDTSPLESQRAWEKQA
ncbi:MAG: hypothetical protein ABI824_14685, partial [Acidobacteriota bacterium]